MAQFSAILFIVLLFTSNHELFMPTYRTSPNKNVTCRRNMTETEKPRFFSKIKPSPTPFRLSPALPSASSASHSAAAPYGNTDAHKDGEFRRTQQKLHSFLHSHTWVFSISPLYLLVDLLVVWVETQRSQEQVSGTLRGISVLKLTLGSHDPQC